MPSAPKTRITRKASTPPPNRHADGKAATPQRLGEQLVDSDPHGYIRGYGPLSQPDVELVPDEDGSYGQNTSAVHIPSPDSFVEPPNPENEHYSVIVGSVLGLFPDWAVAQKAAQVSGGSVKRHVDFHHAKAYYARCHAAGVVGFGTRKVKKIWAPSTAATEPASPTYVSSSAASTPVRGSSPSVRYSSPSPLTPTRNTSASHSTPIGDMTPAAATSTTPAAANPSPAKTLKGPSSIKPGTLASHISRLSGTNPMRTGSSAAPASASKPRVFIGPVIEISSDEDDEKDTPAATTSLRKIHPSTASYRAKNPQPSKSSKGKAREVVELDSDGYEIPNYNSDALSAISKLP